MTLQLAERRLERDPEAARDALARAHAELSEALEELRELARGLHPAVLTDHGLQAALGALAARAPLPVELSVDLDDRLAEPLEAAAYFVVAEALTNVARYASARTVSVTVRRDADDVLVEVIDDGSGGADPDAGTGLRGLIDRVEALGGRLEVPEPRRPRDDGTGLVARELIINRGRARAGCSGRSWRSGAGTRRGHEGLAWPRLGGARRTPA